MTIRTSLTWGCDAPPGTAVPTLNPDRTQGLGIFPCFDYTTLGDELDAAHLTWRYYAPPINQLALWSTYDAVRHIRYGNDWTTNVISPETRVLSDVAAGNLAAVTWVIPDLANSDHAASNSTSGPQWVSSIVNTIGKSAFWQSTAIIVLWDDWGGWYDHVSPPQLDVHGLGVRTPLIVISPFEKHAYVSHVQYETGSVVRFIETQFDLSVLAASDARAADLGDCFDLSAPNGTFHPLAVWRSMRDFLNERSSEKPRDTD